MGLFTIHFYCVATYGTASQRLLTASVLNTIYAASEGMGVEASFYLVLVDFSATHIFNYLLVLKACGFKFYKLG